MVTSRTGTSTWKNLRTRALYAAQRNGLTHCPLCTVRLSYEVGRTANSAEVDHIIPHSRGGKDHMSNVQVICRRCNQSKGNRPSPKAQQITYKVRSSRQW